LSHENAVGAGRRNILIIAAGAAAMMVALWAVTRLSAGFMREDWGRHLCNADCHWFSSILEFGYDRAPRPDQGGYANFAFFPGFPGLASIPRNLFALHPWDALVLTSSVLYVAAAFTFYAYLLRRLDRGSALFGALLFLVSPFAIYGVSGYSEPSTSC